MEITPNDLRQQQFEIKLRGYNADDVEVFRDMAAQALEESRAEALKLSEENKHLKQRLEHLIQLEDTLKAAVLEAQKNADRTLETAKGEAKLIVREAEHKRDEVIADMHRKMGKMVADINKIQFIRTNYLTRLKGFVMAQMEMVERAVEEEGEDEKANDELRNDTFSETTGETVTDTNEKTPDPQPDPPRETQPDSGQNEEEWKNFREHLSEE
jgi:cell division initiation protein